MKVEYREVVQELPDDGRQLNVYTDGGMAGHIRLTGVARNNGSIRYQFYGFAEIGGKIREFQINGFDITLPEPEDVMAAIVGRINLFEMFRGGKRPAAMKLHPDEI